MGFAAGAAAWVCWSAFCKLFMVARSSCMSVHVSVVAVADARTSAKPHSLACVLLRPVLDLFIHGADSDVRLAGSGSISATARRTPICSGAFSLAMHVKAAFISAVRSCTSGLDHRFEEL